MVLLSLCGHGAGHQSQARPGELEIARLSTGRQVADGMGPLPRPLTFGDMVRYRQIFAFGARGRLGRRRPTDRRARRPAVAAVMCWPSDTLIRPPIAPATRNSRRWLERYADLPQATRIYRMALDRRPAGAKPPIAPIGAGSAYGRMPLRARAPMLAALAHGPRRLARRRRRARRRPVHPPGRRPAARWRDIGARGLLGGQGQSARAPAATGRPPPAGWPRKAATSSMACSRRGRSTSGSTSTGTRTSSRRACSTC